MSVEALYRDNRDAVDQALVKHRISRMVAFGGRARGDASPGSDLDLAVRLPPGADLFDLVAVKDDLRAAFSLEVDVVDVEGLKPQVRERADAEGVTLFRSNATGRRSPPPS